MWFRRTKQGGGSASEPHEGIPLPRCLEQSESYFALFKLKKSIYFLLEQLLPLFHMLLYLFTRPYFMKLNHMQCLSQSFSQWRLSAAIKLISVQGLLSLSLSLSCGYVLFSSLYMCILLLVLCCPTGIEEFGSSWFQQY